MSIKDRIDNVSRNDNLSIETRPVMAKVELTGKCTLNCSFCANSSMREKNMRQKFLNEDDFELILKELKSVPSIKEIGLFYMGESGLHPKLVEFAEKAKAAGYFVFLTTNGTVIKNILKAIPNIDSLKVSWNYKDENDFLRKTGSTSVEYNIIVDNIAKLYDECHRCGKTLAISTVLDTSPEDYEEILKKLSYDEHYYIPLQNQGGTNKYGATGVIGQSENTVNPVPCWSLFKGIYIDVDLNARVCCYGHDKQHVIGNLKDNSLGNLINDEELIKWKKQHLENRIPEICSKCLNNIK